MENDAQPWPAARPRASLRLRLALVCGGAATAFSLLTLLLSLVLVDRAALGGTLQVDPRLVIPLGDGTAVTVQQFQQDLRRSALFDLANRGLLLLTALSALAFACSYALADRALVPLKRITDSAQGLSAASLDARIGLTGPDDELKRLADTFDGMLDRLQRSFDAQRRFVADAGHELRTPVAVVRTEVEVALADVNAPAVDLRDSMSVVLDANRKIEVLIEALLILADAHVTAAGQAVALDQLVAIAIADSAEEAAARRVSVRHRPCESSDGVCGDARLLAFMVGAVVDNAIRHNRPGGNATVETRQDRSGQVQLRIVNDGPLVETDLDTLSRPFRRAGTARTSRQGAGLGLAITAEVVRSHGGNLHAVARPNGGLDLTITLPAPDA